MLAAYSSFATLWHWTPRMVDNLYMDEFWYFLMEFEDMAKKEKRGTRPDLKSWLFDPKRKKE